MIINPYIYGVAYDPDAQAFITASGISGTNATATNQLVIDLKAANIWTKMKAIYPMVGGTATSCKWNLKDARDLNAAYRLVFSGGGTFSTNGYSPGGVNGYADTFLSPNLGLNNYNGNLSFYSRTNNTNSGVDIGSYSTTGNYFMQLYSTSLLGSRANLQRNDSNYAIFSSTNRLGFFSGNITGNNNMKIYQNGILKNTNSVVDLSLINSVTITLGGLNNNGTVQNFTNRECAFASIGDGLTDAEALAFYNAVQTFNTSLSRNV